jgi:hypothetical protein
MSPDEATVPRLAVDLKLSGHVFTPPMSARTMIRAARDGEFKVFTVKGAPGRPGRKRKYVRIEVLHEWMKTQELM